MEGLHIRIKRLREAAGLSPYDFAERVGVTYQSVQQWEMEGGTSPQRKRLPRVAEVLGVTLAELVAGDGNTHAGPDIKRRVPLISWVQAGSFASVIDNLHPGEAENWELTTAPIHKHTYALRVRGDSMTNPLGEPTFPDGQVIIVEPDAIDSPDKLVGSFIIVRRNGDDEATFKQLVRDGSRYLLKPLNPQYQILELGARDEICGVVREKTVRYF